MIKITINPLLRASLALVLAIPALGFAHVPAQDSGG